jgi:hypothetical protein
MHHTVVVVSCVPTMTRKVVGDRTSMSAAGRSQPLTAQGIRWSAGTSGGYGCHEVVGMVHY